MTPPAPRNRTYFDGDLRSALLEAAVVACAEVGPAHVSLREVARRVGVSHAAPKNHFADKRALFTAIAVQAHHRLRAHLDAAGHPDQDPLDAVAAIGAAYLCFAREQGARYALMWQEDLQDRDDPDLLAASGATFAPLLVAARALAGPGADGPGGSAEDLAALAWAWVHGLADLSASGALRDLPGGGDPESQQERLLSGFVALLAASGPGARTLAGAAVPAAPHGDEGQPAASRRAAPARAAATAPDPGETVASTVAPS